MHTSRPRVAVETFKRPCSKRDEPYDDDAYIDEKINMTWTKTMTAKLNYEQPACPVCGTSLKPLTERVKKRCHVCGWTILPVEGYDVHTVEHRGYMR